MIWIAGEWQTTTVRTRYPCTDGSGTGFITEIGGIPVLLKTQYRHAEDIWLIICAPWPVRGRELGPSRGKIAELEHAGLLAPHEFGHGDSAVTRWVWIADPVLAKPLLTINPDTVTWDAPAVGDTPRGSRALEGVFDR